MEGMTVAHICSSGGWGGLEMYPLELAERQRAAGHRVVFVSRAGTRLAHSLEKTQIPHHNLKIRSYPAPLAAFRLSRIIESEGVNVLHIHLPRDLMLCYVAAKLARKRVVKILHKHLSVGVRKMDAVHRILYRDLDLTIAISDYVRRSLLRFCPLSYEDVLVVECGLNLNRWQPEGVDRDGLRREYGLSAADRLVGLVGRLDPRKGQEDFIRAAGLLSHKHPDLTFLVVGDSPDEDYKRHLLRLSHELGMGERLIFTGHRTDIAAVVGGLDLLVAPSREESFGLVVIEAMALRKPVVVTDRGAFPEFVSDGVTGRVVNWNDPVGLAGAIEACLARPLETQAITERAYDQVKERFDLGKIVDRLDHLYRILLVRRAATL